ncbi:tRNA threonylcarbamoyladenosine biosynthesis protein TsaE [Chlamydiales bacterium STE3]|nr:tRNA threonylcarbamoyladenosine biosynthesis protein TsaE [Chlamydiales bacterium STE3]
MRIVTSSAEETINAGKTFAKSLPKGAIICFFGDLAAGKTTFIKGLVQEINKSSLDDVCSPTFAYLNIYPGTPTVYHFDLYRLRDFDEFLSMGFDEFMHDRNSICCVEWSERIALFIPSNCVKITIKVLEEMQREIVIE